MYSNGEESNAYSAFNVGGDALLGSPTSSSSSSFSSNDRYRTFFLKYKKPLAFVAAFVILAFVIGLIAVVTRPSEDGGGGGGESTLDSSSSSSATPSAPTLSPTLPPFQLSSSSSAAMVPTSAPLVPGGSSTGQGPPTPNGKLFGFSEAFSNPMSLSYTTLSWSPYDSSFITTRNRSIVQGQPGGAETVLIPAALIPPNYSMYSFSSDYSYFMFRRDFQSLYRHSGVAYYYYVDRTQTPLTMKPIASVPLQYAVFSPSLEAPAVAYVQGNNIFLFSLTSATTVQVTEDGAYGRVINGVCDWVYEEEVYSRTGVIWFSPSGRHMAYLRFDESRVPEYTFPLYALPHNEIYAYKYPKVNDTNSVVTVGLYNIGSGRNYDVDMGGDSVDQYVINVAWIGDTTVAVKVMPRVQASWQLYAISANQPERPPRRLNAQSHPLYLESDFVLHYLPTLSGYIDSVIVNDHTHVGWWNLDGELVRYVTDSPSWGVESVHCYEPQSGYLYLTASYPSSIERSLIRVEVATSTWSTVFPIKAGVPTWQQSSFSGNCSFFTMSEQADPSVLNTRLFRLDAANQGPPTATVISVLRDNANALAVMATYNLPTVRHTTFPSATAPQYRLNGYFITPPTFQGSLEQPDCSYRYPVLIEVYGGPGNQQVSARYGQGGNAGRGFATFMAGSKGYVAMTVDPIGTGGKGDAFRKNFTTLQLWQQEEVDVKAVIDSLKDLCFIDADRIAYWGWSYGGSMATRIATSPLPGKVNTVLAVAPVTDWRLYDSIYTERYMRRPTDNPSGYARTTMLTTRARALTVPSYMVIHGTADDNVHWQNSALLMEQLNRNGQQYAQFHYTNCNHGMNGFFGYAQSNTQHLYRMIYQYFSGMVYGRGGDPNGVVVREEEREEMEQQLAAIDWDSDETKEMLRERFFQP